MNVPVAMLALVLARRYLPAPEPQEDKRTELDPIGVLLLGLTVVCILVPFIEQRSWDSPLRLALFPLAAVLLVLWLLHERRYGRTHEPLVDLDLFRIRSYVLGAGIGLIYFAGFTGHVLHPHAVPAARAALPGVEGGACRRPVRGGRRDHLVARQSPP